MMVKPAPAASFKMAKPHFLFQILIIAFDHPASFSRRHQILEGDVFWQCREPVARWFIFTCRPFDQQPFLGARLVTLSSLDPHTSKTRFQLAGFPKPPRNRAITLWRQHAC